MGRRGFRNGASCLRSPSCSVSQAQLQRPECVLLAVGEGPRRKQAGPRAEGRVGAQRAGRKARTRGEEVALQL